MDAPIHTIASLFDQLGLESSEQAIDEFIRSHQPLPASTELHSAGFWSESQSAFLKQVKDEDADWAEVVDQLDARLR